jgi:hypothetical protein
MYIYSFSYYLYLFIRDYYFIIFILYTFGSLDILVSNAGIQHVCEISTFPEQKVKQKNILNNTR